MVESHPVIYGKPSSDTSSSSRLNQQANNDGYSVKVRTKNRKGIDGTERTTSKITNISIDNKPGDQEEVLLSYEDFLDISVKAKKSAPKISEITEQPPAIVTRKPPSKPAESSTAEAKVQVSREHSQELLVSRPVTALSRMSMESDLDLVVAPGTSRSNLSTPMGKTSSSGSLRQGSSSRGGPRTTSAGRPPPQKPNLHKTSAAVGASIQGSTKPAETEYIHFSQQLIGSQEMDLPKRSPSSNSGAAIQSISNVNNPANDDRSISPVFSNQPLPSSPSIGSLQSPRALSDDGIQTPPSSPKGEPDKDKEETLEKQENIHYAFNIPTAGIVESEIDPSELHPVLEETKEEEEELKETKEELHEKEKES